MNLREKKRMVGLFDVVGGGEVWTITYKTIHNLKRNWATKLGVLKHSS